MKKSSILAVLSLCILLAPLALAGHHFNGTWVAEIEAPRGIQKWAFTFKEENGTLAGTVALPNNTEAEVREGKVEGNSISFKHTLKMRENEFELQYSGVLKEGVIELTRTLPNGNEQQFTAKKGE